MEIRTIISSIAETFSSTPPPSSARPNASGSRSLTQWHRVGFVLLLAGLISLSQIGCRDENSSGDTPTPEAWVADTPTPAPVANVWVSEGDDVAPKLAQLPTRYKKIVATFNRDETYELEATDEDDVVYAFSGDFVTAASDVDGIRRIMLFESSPSEIAYEGMFEIDSSVTPNRLCYEVVQVDPYAGYTAPDPEEGFGSTNGGAYGTDFVQWYNRM